MPDTQIAEYRPTEAALAELREQYEGVTFDVTTKDGMGDANDARSALRRWRTDLEKERKRIKAPALARARDIDSEARRITAEFRELEDPIHAQIKEEAGRAKREKEAAELAEAERVEVINGRISNIERWPLAMVGCNSVEIVAAIRALESMTISASVFGEFTHEAYNIHAESLRKVTELFASAVREEEGRADLERLRAEQEKRAKEEQARIAAEVKARAEAEAESQRKIEEAERAARERIEKEERAAREEREAEEAKARIAMDAKREDERLERKRLEKIQEEEQARVMAEVKARADAEAESRRKIEEAERASRARLEAEERKVRELKEEEQARERAEAAAKEKGAREQAAKKEAIDRKKREKAEAIEREKQRAETQLLDAREMLSTFVDRFGEIEEFAGVVVAIDRYRKGQES